MRNTWNCVKRVLLGRPHESLWALAFFLGGSVQLVFNEYAPAVAQTLGHSTATWWTAYLAIGGAATFIGLVKDKFWWERLGLIASATAGLVYMFCLLAVNSQGYFLGAIIFAFMSVAHLIRAWRVKRRKGPGRG